VNPEICDIHKNLDQSACGFGDIWDVDMKCWHEGASVVRNYADFAVLSSISAAFAALIKSLSNEAIGRLSLTASSK
jgi:hypothetical protein